MNPPVCRTCGAPIAETFITCPACALRKSREMVLEQQKEILPEILHSVREVTLSRPADEQRWHILLAGVRLHTWCDKTAHSSWRRRRTHYGEMAYIAICPSCRDALERLAREIDQAEVR